MACNRFTFVVGPALDRRRLGENGCRPILFGLIDSARGRGPRPPDYAPMRNLLSYKLLVGHRFGFFVYCSAAAIVVSFDTMCHLSLEAE